jgi:hypothetical protein
MPDFDPWTSSLRDAEAHPRARGINGAVVQCVAAQMILEQRAQFEVRPIDGIAKCAKAGLAPPRWLAAAFLRQYDKVQNCTVGTWEEAFGQAHPETKKNIAGLRLRKQYAAKVHHLFNYEHRLPRTLEGRHEAARLLGITEKQVRALLPKTRANVKGHKPMRPELFRGFSAHNPFSLG